MILVKLQKCLLAFTEQEFQGLLARDKVLWAKAIERGKWLLRRQAAERRRLHHTGEILPGVVRDIARRGGGDNALD